MSLNTVHHAFFSFALYTFDLKLGMGSLIINLATIVIVVRTYM